MVAIPKIIEDIKNTILTEARRQVLENGYQNMTIRSVASECNIAVGTIYNYYPSKNVLTASFMLDDWLKELEIMKQSCVNAAQPSECFELIYAHLQSFDKKYSKLFSNSSAVKSSAVGFSERHKYLRSQIAELISDNLSKYKSTDNLFLSEFIAESLIAWSLENKPYKELEPILAKIY